MKTLIIYDTLYGSTKRIAEAIAGSFPAEERKLLSVAEAKQSDLLGLDLLVFGSPTHGGRPKPSAQAFLDLISSGALEGIKVATYDTRFSLVDQNFFLRLVMRAVGYAAPKIMKYLESKGGQRITPPEGFIVEAREGGLLSGEEERAADWGGKILNLFNR